MRAHDLVRLLRNGWPWIVAATLFFGGSGVIISETRAPQYQASAVIAVTACIAVDRSEVCDPIGGFPYAAQLAEVVTSLSASGPVLQATYDATSVANTRQELSAMLEALHNSESTLVTIVAESSDPEAAAILANTHSESIVTFARSAFANGADNSRFTIATVSPAIEPATPTSSGDRTVLLFTLLGLFLGLAIAILKWVLDTRLYDGEAATQLTGMEVLGVIPMTHTRDDTGVSVESTAASRAFRRLQVVIDSRRPALDTWSLALLTPGAAELSEYVGHGLGLPAPLLDSDRADMVISSASGTDEAEMLDVARRADAALIVIDEGDTHAHELTRMIHAIGLVRVPVLGLVVVSRSRIGNP